MIKKFCRTILLAGSALITSVALVNFASAQDVVSTVVTGTDFGWVYDIAFPFVREVALGLGSLLVLWIGFYVKKYLNIQIDAGQRAVIDQGLSKAIDYGLSRLGDKTRGSLVIDINHPLVDLAARYAKTAIPETLAKFKIDDGRLREMIVARLAPATE